MNYEEWKNEEKRTYDFLDRFDLSNYIDDFKGKPVHDLMDYLEDNLDHQLEFPTYLFNVIDRDDFSEYLKKKYDVNIYEVPILG